MKFSKLVEFVSKKPLPAHTKHLIVEVMVSDEEGEDVEVCSPCDQFMVRTALTNTSFRFPSSSCTCKQSETYDLNEDRERILYSGV